MSPPASESRRITHALKIHQWLPEWNEIEFDLSHSRARPSENFYLFSMPAADLRALSGIFRRSTEGGLARELDLGIQRRHDSDRSDEIHEFVVHGFPWSALSAQRRTSGEFDDLKKPGWLPTAIVVNILKRDDTRNGQSVHPADIIDLQEESSELVRVQLPVNFDDTAWQPTAIAPIEVIDGQHRLWAFQERDFAPGFSLPVVAFHGLDISWQAYLFYTINIKPKRINTSLAFDLYPLLRTEDWLERFEGHPIYRETRAQEITEALWSYTNSPWRDRIDMLGNQGGKWVTQAAWIRSLLATFIKSYESRRVRIGGLFGAPLGNDRPVLGWSRAQQSAFIIYIWQEIERTVASPELSWAQSVRELKQDADSLDAAFAGRFTLLNTDQGVRGVLAVFNDLLYAKAAELNLDELESDEVGNGTSESAITQSLSAFRATRSLSPFVEELSKSLASYDWRTSATPGISDQLRQAKARFRGGTGYRELRSDLLHHVAGSSGMVADTAVQVVDELGF